MDDGENQQPIVSKRSNHHVRLNQGSNSSRANYSFRAGDSNRGRGNDPVLADEENEAINEIPKLDHRDSIALPDPVLPVDFGQSGADRDGASLGDVADGMVAESVNATEQMPQMPQPANATNATTQTIENAQPSGWGKLWRIEKNGNYYIYRLRFHEGRITRPGGKITAAIEAKCHNRKGKGRHKESRQEAERYRGRALDIANRIRSVS